MAAPAERNEIQTQLAAFKGYSDWEAFKQQIRFRKEDAEQGRDETIPVKNAFRLNYSKLQEKLGINLEIRKRGE